MDRNRRFVQVVTIGTIITLLGLLFYGWRVASSEVPTQPAQPSTSTCQ